jgi:hypothetical protein
MVAGVEHEIRFVDGQASRVAFDAAIHGLLWLPVSRLAFFTDGAVLVESDDWQLRAEPSFEPDAWPDAWDDEDRDGLTVFSSGRQALVQPSANRRLS